MTKEEYALVVEVNWHVASALQDMMDNHNGDAFETLTTASRTLSDLIGRMTTELPSAATNSGVQRNG